MNTINRRAFVKQSLAAAATVTILDGKKVWGANDKVVVGVMGVGGRGTAVTAKFAEQTDVKIACICDVDTRKFNRVSKIIEDAQGHKPKAVQDFRKMLEDKSLDAIINATPDHWHALGSILACQAGKDVYVEKPMSWSIWEGRKMVEAARKYGRVVQVGMQSRSAAYMKKAVEYVKSGKLGDVYLVRVLNMMQHPPQKITGEQPVPEGFDYDIWCGPAAKLPYNPSRRWLNFWEYSCGPIAGDAVHQLDLARFLTGDVPCPKAVSQTGAIYSLRDGRDTPDTQIATYEYDKFTLQFESTLWTPYMKKISIAIRESDDFPEWPFCATKIEIYGTKNLMYVGRHGGGWQVHDANGKLIDSTPGRPGDTEHVRNFIECIRTRARANADVEHGHYSAMLCHLANASFRVGNQRLVIDPKTETFPGTPAANQYLKRAVYRTPWVIPEKV